MAEKRVNEQNNDNNKRIKHNDTQSNDVKLLTKYLILIDGIKISVNQTDDDIKITFTNDIYLIIKKFGDKYRIGNISFNSKHKIAMFIRDMVKTIKPIGNVNCELFQIPALLGRDIGSTVKLGIFNDKFNLYINSNGEYILNNSTTYDNIFDVCKQIKDDNKPKN